ncbi:MAG: ImmA/IrrE family metallo-endopeptidase [Desulfarculus sp.]|jgi:Zn-dependent peptidase ImmA (M78 family)|nr:MAG: ImmA/IrrE family metallo-endopeptidase [Desulfarculus sp.]
MSRVAVASNILLWALDRSNLSADQLKHKFPKIGQWISGESQPTLRQLEYLAKVTLTPLGFFFLDKPPQERLPVPYFRTLGDNGPSRPSPDLLETIQSMQRRQLWKREFLKEQGNEPLNFVGAVPTDSPPQVTAEIMRRTLGFQEGWASELSTWADALRLLLDTTEQTGIIAVANGIVGNNTHRKLDPNEFRGFVLVDEYAPLVFINGADGKAAQMFTLAHELAHIFYGSSAAFDLREMLPADDPTEQACNRAAAEFLVPGFFLLRYWPSIKTEEEPFQAIARRFKVSAIVAARRVLDLGLITRKEYFTFYENWLADDRRTSARRVSGGDFYANQNLRIGKRFFSTILRAAREGKLLYTEAYQLTGLFGKSFDNYASHLGMM